jgi:hypothetical protein
MPFPDARRAAGVEADVAHHRPSVCDVRSLALTFAGCVQPLRTRDTRAGVASRMAFGTFDSSAGDQFVPLWRSQVS